MHKRNVIASGWPSAHAITVRSKAIISAYRPPAAHDAPKGPSEALGAALEAKTTAFEAFNSVCQMSVAYPAEKSTLLARLLRSKLLDAMLARNHCTPIFATLSDEEEQS